MGIKISFIGDIALNNNYSKFVEVSPFNGVIKSFNKSDYLVGNLEAFAEGDNGFNEKKKPYLYSPGNALNLLSHLPLNLVSLANNHLLDTFEDGLDNTIKTIDNLNIQYFGIDYKKNKDYFIHTETINDKKFAFVNAFHLDTHPNIPPNSTVNLFEYDIIKLQEIVKNLSLNYHHVILTLHWGGTSDYGHFPDRYQKVDARKLIDAGASAIIGHHSHCVQPVEYYKNKPIIYSLGNFCFDDIDSHGRVFKIRKTGKIGYIAHLTFNEDVNVEIELIRNVNLEIIAEKLNFKSRIINYQFKLFKLFPVLHKVQRFYLKKIEPKIFYLEMSDKNIFQMMRTINCNKLKSLFKA